MPRQKTVSSGTTVSRARRPKQPEVKAGVAHPDEHADAQAFEPDLAADLIPVTDEPIATSTSVGLREADLLADDNDRHLRDDDDDESEDEEDSEGENGSDGAAAASLAGAAPAFAVAGRSPGNDSLGREKAGSLRPFMGSPSGSPCARPHRDHAR